MATCDTNSTDGNIQGHYSPFGNGPSGTDEYNAVCSPDTVIECEVGDLTGKHSTIDVMGKISQCSTYSLSILLFSLNPCVPS